MGTMITFLVESFGARWRPGFFRLGGFVALSSIGRVSPPSRGRSSVGRDCITSFPESLDVPADYT